MAEYLISDSVPPATKITVLISGNGSNLQALIDATTSGLLPSTTIVRVISDKKAAYGLVRAENAGIPTAKLGFLKGGKYFEKGADPDNAEVKQRAREAYDADLAALVLKDKPDLVVCAGWMRIVSPKFLDPLAAANLPVINLHPALPSKYDGIDAIQRAHADFLNDTLANNTTGAMIHYVIREVDQGQPILVQQVACQVNKDGTKETLESLTQRIHDVEHDIIVRGTALATAALWQQRQTDS